MRTEDAVLGIHHALATLGDKLAVRAVPCDDGTGNARDIDRHGDLCKLTQVGVAGELKTVITLLFACDSENKILAS